MVTDNTGPNRFAHGLPAIGLIASFSAVTLGLAAKLISVNEYAAQGIPSAYDCDGPVVIAYLLAVSLGLGLVGISTSIVRWGRTWAPATALLLCGVALLLAVTELPEWYAEAAKNAAEGSPCR